MADLAPGRQLSIVTESRALPYSAGLNMVHHGLAAALGLRKDQHRHSFKLIMLFRPSYRWMPHSLEALAESPPMKLF